MNQIQMNDNEVIEALKAGKVALLPTDTVYGLAASPLFDSAIDKIFKIKGRPKQVNLPIMLSSPAEIPSLGVKISDYARKLINSEYIPGAITLVLGFDDTTQRAPWLNGREEVAIRIPADKWLQNILKQVGPLLVTSANAHGSKVNMGDVNEILSDIFDIPDIVIDNGLLSSEASTIVNCRHKEIIIEREGQISKETIYRLIENE